MPGIKPAITDVLTRLTTVQVLNQDAQTVPLVSRIFNNQIKRQKAGTDYAIPLPSAFLEVVNNANYNRLGNGVSESDIVFRIYLTHWFTDAQDGTLDQDLLIFDLRDAVISCLSNYRPTFCGNMCLTAEGQDYDHDDIYVYVLEFTTGFTDTKGSAYDTGRTDYTQSSPPTQLDLIVNESETISYPDFAMGYYIIPQSQGTGDIFKFPYLKGKTGYAVYSTQLNQFLIDDNISYDENAGSFTILVPEFEFVPEYVLIVFPNEYITDLPIPQ